jgi:hypothetical protein
MVRFGPVEAAVVVEEPEEPALNFILGAAAPSAVEDGYLPAAVKWMERHDVEYRVPLAPGLPEFAAAEEWLARHRYRLVAGPAKLLRDGSPPRFLPPPGIDIYERVDPWEDEGFGDPLAAAGAVIARSTATSRWPTWQCTSTRASPCLRWLRALSENAMASAKAPSCTAASPMLPPRVARRWRSPRLAASPPSPIAKASSGPVLRTSFAPSPGSLAPGLRPKSRRRAAVIRTYAQKDLTGGSASVISRHADDQAPAEGWDPSHGRLALRWQRSVQS